MGGSILPQAMRSDIGQILTAVEEARVADADQLTQDRRGLLDFTRALTLIFAGNFAAAEEVLSEMQVSVEENRLAGIWPARLALLGAIKSCHQNFPPILTFWKSHDGVTCVLKNPLGEYINISTGLTKTKQVHNASFTTEDELEFLAAADFLMVPLQIWNHNIPFCKAFARSFQYTAKNIKQMEELTQKTASLRQGLKGWAQRLDNAALDLDFKLIDLQLDHSSDASTYKDDLQFFRTNASLCNDHATTGLLDMMMGDKLVSPAFTSPLALNLVVMESENVGSRNYLWDPVEHILCLQSSVEVEEMYSRALGAFIKAKASRGRGAILMRQACLIYGSRCDDELLPNSDVLESARGKLMEAIECLGMDFTQVQIAKCHLIILDILQSKDSSAIHGAAVTGQACADAKNLNIGRFIGMLLLRFGRRQLALHSRLDITLLSYRCAEACFSKLGMPSLVLKTLFAQNWALLTVGNDGAALEVLYLHQPIFRTLIQDLDRQRTVQVNSEDSITGLQGQLFTEYTGLIQRTYLKANHPAQMQEWDEEFQNFMARPEVIAHSERLVLQKDIANFALEYVPEEERQRLLRAADSYHIWNRKQNVALNRYRRARDSMDLDQATKELQLFVDSLACLPEGVVSYLAYPLGIAACNEIGDTTRAQTLLGKIPYEKLFYRTVRTVYQGPELWVRLADTRHFAQVENIDMTLYSCVIARDWKTGQKIIDEINSLVPSFLSAPEIIKDYNLAFRLNHAALIALNNGDDVTAFSLLLKIVRYLHTRRNSIRYADLRRDSSSNAFLATIPVLVATQCERNSHKNISMPTFHNHFDIQPRSWLEAAVLFEEQGKARQLRDLLDLSESPIPSDGSQNLSDNELLLQLRRLPVSELTTEEMEEIRVLEAKAQASDPNPFSQAYKLPEYKPQDLNLSDLFSTLPPKVLVLSMSFSRYSSVLAAMDVGGVQKVYPLASTDIEVQRLAVNIVNALSCSDDSKRGGASATELHDHILELSRLIIAPIDDLLDHVTHIIFVPGQPLTSFPFQILLHRGTPLFLSKSTSLAPGLATLRHLHGRQKPIEPIISAVCKPSTPAEFSRTNEALIPMASIEAISVARLFNTWPQASSQVDRKAFKATLERSAVIHVGTHGRRHPISPWLAHLSLKEKLYVLDLANMRSTAALVVFSACLSGRGFTTLGNDEFGFATAVLASGCQCYLGSLWEIDDVATLLLMTAFYKHMATTPDISVAEMLRLAQCEVFHMTRDRATARLEEIMQTIDEATLAGMKLNDLVRRPKSLLKRQVENLPDSFAHPFYWAGFMPVGNALLRMAQSGT